MRVTNQMLFADATRNYQRTSGQMFNEGKRINSGTKIQQGYENSSIFIDTMRLDYDIVSLNQVTQSSSKAKTFADNTSKSLEQMSDIFRQMKLKLVNAANSGIHSPTSMEAIANDLEGLKQNLLSIANTSINGQFLFSGTLINQKPIAQNGDYLGNHNDMQAVVGSNVNIGYNINGGDLFLGDDLDYSKIVTTNVKLTDKLDTEKISYIDENSTIKQLSGYESNSVFYMQGTRPDGSSFSSRFSLSSENKTKDLLDKIGTELGNTPKNKFVQVSMNKSGNIIIEDLKKGNNMLNVHLVGAVDTKGALGIDGDAKVDEIDKLQDNLDVKVINFIKGQRSDIKGQSASGVEFDKVAFLKKGSLTTGTIPQYIKNTNQIATNTTTLSQVAQGSVVGQNLSLKGKTIEGVPFEVTVQLLENGSNVIFHDKDAPDDITKDKTFELVNDEGKQTPANEVTYRQLNDIVSMATAGVMPETFVKVNDEKIDTQTQHAKYNDAIIKSRKLVETNIDYKGQIQLKDNTNANSKIQFSMFDKQSGKFGNLDTAKDGSFISFAQNNAISVDEPRVDIFKDIDNMIQAVRDGIHSPDASLKNSRNIGVEFAIKRLDHIKDHVEKRNTKIGSLSNTFDSANSRAKLLSLNVKTIQSEIIDTDYGESLLKLQQLQTQYQAILQASSRINSLSLVNYL